MRWSMVFLFLLLGCSDLTGAEPFTPPDVYREWFAKTVACSGKSGKFDLIAWESVPRHKFRCRSGWCVGTYRWPNIIALSEDYTMHEMVVRHEMLHYLLGPSARDHPPLYFKQLCHLTWDTWHGAPASR